MAAPPADTIFGAAPAPMASSAKRNRKKRVDDENQAGLFNGSKD